MSPPRTMIFPPTTPQTQWQTSQPNRRGGEDVGDLSTVRPTLGRAGEQASRLLPLAPCPVEGRGLSGRDCTPWIPTSTSNCSLRYSRNPRLPFFQLRPIFRNQPIHQLLATTASASLSSCQLQVQNSPRLVFLQLSPIPVHGYDRRSRPFPLIASKGRMGASSLLRHGVPPHGSPHSTAGRPTLTARCGLTRARPRER